MKIRNDLKDNSIIKSRCSVTNESINLLCLDWITDLKMFDRPLNLIYDPDFKLFVQLYNLICNQGSPLPFMMYKWRQFSSDFQNDHKGRARQRKIPGLIPHPASLNAVSPAKSMFGRRTRTSRDAKNSHRKKPDYKSEMGRTAFRFT